MKKSEATRITIVLPLIYGMVLCDIQICTLYSSYRQHLSHPKFCANMQACQIGSDLN